MGTRGKIIASLLVVLLAVGLVALAVTTFGGDGDGDGDGDEVAGSDTTTTTVAPGSTTASTPTTTRSTLAPVPTDPPLPTSVPPGTVVVSPTTLPPATTAPPATVAGPPQPPDVSTATTMPAPTTTTPPTTTTVPDADITAETVEYSPPDGPRRKGELQVPGAEHRTTAIVLVHDGDGTDGSRHDLEAWASAYASAGYVTLSIDHYLYKDASSAPLYPRAERDVKAAVQYLRLNATELGIDPDRIVVQGFGYGGRLACQAIVTGDDPFFAGSALYEDVSDAPNGMIGFYGPYDGTHDDSDLFFGGPPDSDDPEVQERYALANCTANAATAAGPVLLVHGDADDVVPLDVASAFTDALTAESKDGSLLIFEGFGHGFDIGADGALTPEGEAAFVESLAWLDAKFPETAPAP